MNTSEITITLKVTQQVFGYNKIIKYGTISAETSAWGGSIANEIETAVRAILAPPHKPGWPGGAYIDRVTLGLIAVAGDPSRGQYRGEFQVTEMGND